MALTKIKLIIIVIYLKGLNIFENCQELGIVAVHVFM